MQKTPVSGLTMIIAHPGQDTALSTRRAAEALGICVTAHVNSADALVSCLRELRPDLIGIHILLPGFSKREFLKHPAYTRLVRRPFVFYACPKGATRLMTAGFAPLIYASPEPGALFECIRAGYPPAPTKEEIDRAERVFLFLGFQRGRALGYLAYAAGLCLISADYAVKLSRVIYPEIARVFGVTEKHAGEAMRRAADKAFLSGDIDRQYALFQNTIEDTRGKPTLSALLARVSEILRLGEDEGI